MDGDEVFRAPGWSAGLLHLHFSVARGIPGEVEEKGQLMIKGGERKPHVEGRHGNRVSSAVWPASVRRVVATGKAAQRRRDWIMQGRWWIILADVLSLRILFILTTLLVVVSSLLVAILGLHFWYILVVPLLLFTLLLLAPFFLASRTTVEATPPSLSLFTQELRSSTGILSLYAQELRSNPGFLQELKSNPGFLQELKSNPGYLQELKSNPGFLQTLRSSPGVLSGEAPATPMPADPPLVRVLETYDLRSMPAKSALGKNSSEETGKHTATHYMERAFWNYSVGTEPLAPDHVLYHREESAPEQDTKPPEEAM